MLAVADLQPLLGLKPDEETLKLALSALFPGRSLGADTKSYPDAVYQNYYSLGISLCFEPDASKVMRCVTVDMFNSPTPGSSTSAGGRPPKGPTYDETSLPLVFEFAEKEIVLPPRQEGEKEMRLPREPRVEVRKNTTGREIVRSLGEPSRKGSGSWVGVWLEWNSVGLLRAGERVDVGVMLELNDPKGADQMSQEQMKQGMGGLWDMAAGWRWGGIKVFKAEPKKSS